MAYLLLRDLQFAGDLLSVLDSQLIQLNGGKERGSALTMQHFPRLPCLIECRIEDPRTSAVWDQPEQKTFLLCFPMQSQLKSSDRQILQYRSMRGAARAHSRPVRHEHWFFTLVDPLVWLSSK